MKPKCNTRVSMENCTRPVGHKGKCYSSEITSNDIRTVSDNPYVYEITKFLSIDAIELNNVLYQGMYQLTALQPSRMTRLYIMVEHCKPGIIF